MTKRAWNWVFGAASAAAGMVLYRRLRQPPASREARVDRPQVAGHGLRREVVPKDPMDEALWESFPASDPPSF